jgi:hypothetical protein
VRSLLNVTAVLRPYWKCLQKLNDIDSLSLNQYLEDWNKSYRQNVNFYNNDNPPEKFDLTGFYPLYSDDENVRLDKEIDDLIKVTDLTVPKYKTCVCLDSSYKESLAIKNLDRGEELCQLSDSTRFRTIVDAVSKGHVGK